MTRGLDVTVIELMDRIMPRSLDDAGAAEHVVGEIEGPVFDAVAADIAASSIGCPISARAKEAAPVGPRTPSGAHAD